MFSLHNSCSDKLLEVDLWDLFLQFSARTTVDKYKTKEALFTIRDYWPKTKSDPSNNHRTVGSLILEAKIDNPQAYQVWKNEIKYTM